MTNKIADRDYVLLLDRSSSMSTEDQGGKTRWQAAEEGTLGIVRKCVTLDPDGIDVVTFANQPKLTRNVKDDSAVRNIFSEQEPNGSTNLTAALEVAFTNHFGKPKTAEGKTRGTTIVVITDGEPDDRVSVAKSIVGAANKIDADEDLAVSFIQIGNDPRAKAFLNSLDNDLKGQGAKFDIVDAKTMDDVGNSSVAEVLAAAISD